MDAVAKAAEAQAGFSLAFFHKLLEKGGDGFGNAVVSPASVTGALAMAAAGAAGSTLTEIEAVARLEGAGMHEFAAGLKRKVLCDGSGAGGPLVSFANGIWVTDGATLQGPFRKLLQGTHGSEIRSANFAHKAEQERSAINSWVSQETRGKIEDLLPTGSVSESTSVVLANALYYKGKWAEQFDPKETKSEDFHLLNGKTVNVPCLKTQEKQRIRCFPNYKVLQLPYATGDDQRRFSMYILLPDDPTGLPELEKRLDAKLLLESCTAGTKKVAGEFSLPKFKISTSVNLKELLTNMGLKEPFSITSADFSGMVEGEMRDLLYISDAVHKAFVEVNEEGTEAAAASGFAMMTKAYVPPTDFVANHPFLYILKEDVSGLIVFMGRITNPSVSD